MDPVLIWSARWVLALLFLLGALAKITRFAAFRASVAGYALLPVGAVGLVSSGVIGLELCIAATALVPALARWAMLAAAGLLALFSLAIGLAMRRGASQPGQDCGCGVGGHSPLGHGLLGRNLLLMLVALAGGQDPGPQGLSGLDPLLVAALVGLSLIGWVALNRLEAVAKFSGAGKTRRKWPKKRSVHTST